MSFASGSAGSVKKAVTIRKDFPETFIWEDILSFG